MKPFNQIAVLIPTYKPEIYIDRCFESLDKQTLSKELFTVYIALNGPDLQFENFILGLLEKYSFQYEYIYLSEKGVSNARNHLIDISVEPYIVFIDDDDILSKNYLEDLLLNSTQDFMGVSNVKSFERDINESMPNYIGIKFKSLANEETSKFKARQYYSTPWAKMLHRRMIGNVRFDTSLSKGEDALFMTEISTNIEGIRKTQPSATYYVYERIGSATRSKTNTFSETKRVVYLTIKYTKMLFNHKSDKVFIASRIAATLKHLKNIF